MKQINNFNKSKLYMEPSFQFFKGIDGRIIADTPAKLGLTTEYPPFKSALTRMDQALETVAKSSYTEKLNEADMKRDQLFQAIRSIVSAALYHFDATKKVAGKELNVVIEGYKKISTASQEKETGMIYNLLQDLRSDKYKAYVTALELGEWLTQLEAANEVFNELVESRINESIDKVTGGATEPRKEVEAAYEVIVKKVNALAVVNGDTDYAGFIDYVNARIVYFKSILSHQGLKQPGNKPNNPNPEDPDPLPTPDPDENPDIL
jgi:Family of unknown function (DUF6261)